MLPKEWLYIIPNNDENYILYAPLHRKTVKITSDAAKGIIPILNGTSINDNLQSEVMSFLADYDLLVSPEQRKTSKNKSTKIFLSITNKCNLRCIYCYASAGIDNSSMSFDIAKKALDNQLEEIIASADDTIAVTFHGGGEALVELKLLKKIVVYINKLAKENGLRTTLNCVTNATLITKEVAEWLAANFTRLTVSLDGSQKIQDKQRPNSTNSGSFHKAMEGIYNLIDEEVDFAIRSTVTELNVAEMGEFVQFVKENIFHNGGNVHFEPVSLAGRAKNADSFATDPKTFLTNYMKARQIGQEVGINVECSMDTFGFTKESYCGASKGTLQCYTPDGLLSSCTRVTKKSDDGASLFLYGDIGGNQLNINPDAKSKIISFGNNFMDECYSCFARWNCQGGCPMSRFDGKEHLKHTCYVTRELLLYDLRSILDVHSVNGVAS